MDERGLRKRCEERVRELELPMPFDVESFCAVISEGRGRPIVLHPAASGAGPYGLWAAGPSTDVIFYEEATSPLHQEHIILHELSHLLCSHEPAPVTEDEVAELLFPHLKRDTIQRVLRRGGYSTDEEREAEIMASLIVERVSDDSVQNEMRDPGERTVMERIQVSLDVESDRVV